MRKRILSILVSVSMALLLVPAVPFAMANEDAAGGTPNTPSVTAFATKDQLMTEFSSDNATNIGKLVFGKNSKGKPQEWFVMGKNESVEGDNTILFAASPIKTNVKFFDNPTVDISYDSSLGCDYTDNVNYKDGVSFKYVYPNHYGMSDLRKTLRAIAEDSSFFAQEEQSMMNSTPIKTRDERPHRVEDMDGEKVDVQFLYTVTDKLYVPGRYTLLVIDKLEVGARPRAMGSGEYRVDPAFWSGGGEFWTRSPDLESAMASTHAAMYTANGATNKFRSQYVNAQSLDVRPAGNLNLNNVLFASAAEASADGVTAGTIASGKAMTLRMDGSGKRVGSATYDPDSGVIVADLNVYADGPVSLVVQGKDGTRDWYYSQRLYISLSGGTQVTAAQIKAATGASSVDLSKCKIWVENTDASARMIYAVPAVKASIDVTTIDSVELTGMTPTANKDLPTRVTCSPEGMFVTESGVTYTTRVDGRDVAATGTATWNTTYKGKVTLSAVALAENRYAFASSVTATVDGKKLDAAFSPDKGGSLTVTCEFTTPKRCAITGIAVAPSVPENNTFVTYYGFDGYKALPTDGDELGSTASVAVLDRQENSTQNVNMPVTWSFVGGYEKGPGASNKLAWTIPANALADYDVTGCPGYDAATGSISGTVEMKNKEATPVSIADSGASNHFVFQSPSTAVDVSVLFDIDSHAGTAHYYLSEGTAGGASLAGSVLTVTQPGAYSVNLLTDENGIYAEGYASALVWLVEPFKDLAFETATYGYSPITSQSVTFTNLSDSYALTSIEATSRYFEVSGLPDNSSVAPGQTAELSVKPKDGLDAGTYSEVIVIYASSAGDYGYDSYITASFTVNKAGITPAVAIGDWTYGSNPAEADISGNPGGGSVTFFHKPQGAADSAYTAGLPVDAGSYTLKAAVAETANYLGGEATCDFEVSKADATVSAAPSAKSGLSYTGLPQELVNAGTASGGTMEYSLNGGEWSSAVPTATKVGSYTVSYRVAGDANHYDAAGGTVSASIAVAKTAIGLSTSASSLSGGGTVTLTVNTSWLPAGADYKLVCMDSEVAFSVAGQDAYSVTLPNKTQRYAFRAYCAATDNFEGSESDHVYVEVTYLEPPAPPAQPPTIDLPVTAGGSGGILAGGQLVGSKVVVSDIAQDTVEGVLESPGVGQGALKLDLTGLSAPVKSAQLSKPTVGGLVKATGATGKGVESVTIAMDEGSIELDRQALSSVEQQMGDDVEVGLEEKGAGELNTAQQQALAKYGEMAKCVEASIKSSRSAIHSFGGGTVRISVSFKPAEGADPACYKVVYVAEDGSVEYHDAVYKNGTLSFSTSHLSTYAVVYIEPDEGTLALAEALGALPEAAGLKTADAKATVAQARELLEQVAALADDQRAVVGEELVANAEQVVERGTALIATADKKAVGKVRDKALTVRAGAKKAIAFKTTASAAGTRVTYKKTSGSKYITVTKAGKVTAKKGMKQGRTYTAKVKVTCGKAVEYVRITVRAS